MIRVKRGRWWGLVAITLALGACAAPQGARQAEEELTGPRALEEALKGLPEALASLQSSEAGGKVADIQGYGGLMAPVLLPLAKTEISAIPATPGLRAFLGQVRRRWLTQERRPFTEAEFRATAEILDLYVQAVKLMGGTTFIRFATTDENGTFAFAKLPAGWWAVAAEMNSPASGLFWVVSGQLHEGSTVPVRLGNDNLLLEWLRDKPAKETADQ